MRRQRELVNFLVAFLQGSEPSPELLAAFILGLIVINILAQVLYDLFVVPAVLPGLWRPLVMILLMTGAAYLFYKADRRRTRVLRARVDESRQAPPHAGIIWLFGPGGFDHLLFALEHHRQGGGASHCWLVMQDVKPVHDAYARLSQTLQANGWSTQLHPVLIQQVDVASAYRSVREIFEQEASQVNLTSQDIIADITGGLKPLTAGMVLAALTVGGALEYVESDRDKNGEPIPGTQRVVLLDTAFYVTRER